jgi:hypothetical protein
MTFAGPNGLHAGGQPQPNGYMWLLAQTHGVANLQQLNLTTDKIDQVIPVSLNANSVSQSPSGVVGVGLGSATTGALELRNGSSGILIATVPSGAPVKDVFAGADGSTFYVLNGNSTSNSVTLVNSQTDHPSTSVPVPLDTIAIAVDPSGQTLLALGSDGTMNVITIGSGAIASGFRVGTNPVRLSVSSIGSIVYVLSTATPVASVAAIDVATERQTKVLPAPSNTVDIQVSSDGRSLYDIVGTASYGNVQVFPIGP